MLTVLTASKDFNDRWVGHRYLNARGLHRGRVRMADLARRLRTAQASSDITRALAADGCVAVERFLPEATFGRLRDSVEARVEALSRAHPAGDGGDGFGSKRPFPGGFDRHDGGTLNRFIEIDWEAMPEAAIFAADPRLAALSRVAVGRSFPARRLSIYLTRSGAEGTGHDIQSDLHRDTFHATLKFWYFLRPVTREDGPFAYVPGSHRQTRARLDWEDAEARRVTSWPRGKRHGAFRIDPARLSDLGLPPPRLFAVPANTLVLADTVGFHNRTPGHSGAERLALYGALRPWPFAPV